MFGFKPLIVGSRSFKRSIYASLDLMQKFSPDSYNKICQQVLIVSHSRSMQYFQWCRSITVNDANRITLTATAGTMAHLAAHLEKPDGGEIWALSEEKRCLSELQDFEGAHFIGQLLKQV